MVPLSALTKFESRSGPEFTMRYNEYRSAQINGSAAPGYSSDQATAALEDVFKQTMPREMGFDYMGMSYQEQKAREGVPASVIFGFSLLFVFLILAALYESWSLAFQRASEHAGGGIRRLWSVVAAPGRAQRFLSRLHGADRKRCLLANRPGDADRSGRQERDSDRRVCQGTVRKGEASGGCGARRRQASPAADPDDLVRVHSRLRAAMDGDRRRFGGAPDHGHGRDRRHAGGERHRHFFHSGDLLSGGEMVRRWQGARSRCSASNARAGAGRLRCATNSWTRETPAERFYEEAAAIDFRCPGIESDGRVHGRPELPSARRANSTVYRDLAESPQAQAQAASYADLPWWQVFQDPQLQELIRTALKQNYDLQLATERIIAARAQLAITRSSLFPQVQGDGNFTGGKENNFQSKSNFLALTADAAFQLDFFGKLRRATEAARAQLLATEDAQQYGDSHAGKRRGE